MAAHNDPKGTLFPRGLTNEELSKLFTHHKHESLSAPQLEEHTRTRDELLRWYDKSIAQYERLFEQSASRYPQLVGITPENYKEKRGELVASGIPEYVWEPFEEASRLSEHREEVASMPTPLLASPIPEGPHKHEEYAALGPQYLDQDSNYERMVGEKINEWNSSHPEQKITGKALLSRADGSRYINPEALTHMPSLEKEVRLQFAAEHKSLSERYDKNEKKRIYTDGKGNVIPENDPAYKDLQENIAEKSRQEVAKRKDEIAEKAKTTYAFSAMAVDEKAIEQQIREEEYRAFRETHLEKAEAYAQNDLVMLRVLEISTIASGGDEQEKDDEQNPQISGRQARELGKELQGNFKSPNPSPAQPIEAPTSMNPTGELSNTARRLPARAMRSLGNAGGKIQQGTARAVGSIAARAAPLLANPWTWVVIAAVIILVIIIIVIVNTMEGEEGSTIPVIVSKSAPERVGNGEEISYSVGVSYAGKANDIILSDKIPDNTKFASASGIHEYNDTTKTVTWYASKQPEAPPQEASDGASFNYSVYAAEGFPQPTTAAALDTAAVQLYKTGVGNYVTKAAQAIGVDPGLIAFWSFFEGINYDISFNNCAEGADRFNPNLPCSSGNWQVGSGLRPTETAGYLQEAFDAMYGNHDDGTVQRVGQNVIQTMASRYPDKAITYPSSTFPQTSLSALTSNMDNLESRTWVAHLMRDDALYAYVIGKVFKGHWDSPGALADTMESSWGSPSHYDRTRVMSYIKAVYDLGISGGGGVSYPAFSFTLYVNPTKEDFYATNRATAQVIGGSGGGGGGGLPGQPLPSQDVQEIKEVLCTSYKVCPTVNKHSPPDSDWTLPQITALWNVVQRIYASPQYKQYAIGGYTLEVTRASCYPPDICNSGTWGYYAGIAYPGWNTVPGARLVVATNLVPKDGSIATIEWLLAHEIGHSGSHGAPDGSLSSCGIACNAASQAVINCSDPPSEYAKTHNQEYVAEAISYYMTSAEEAITNYIGGTKNLLTDHACVYNAVKSGFFNNVEY